MQSPRVLLSTRTPTETRELLLGESRGWGETEGQSWGPEAVPPHPPPPACVQKTTRAFGGFTAPPCGRLWCCTSSNTKTRVGVDMFLLLCWLMSEAHSRQYGCNRKVLKTAQSDMQCEVCVLLFIRDINSWHFWNSFPHIFVLKSQAALTVSLKWKK